MVETIVAGHPRLTPHLVLLARRDERVQIGWSPDTRMILAPPPGLDAATMIGALRLLDGQRSLPEVLWRAAERGVDSAAMSAVVRVLDEAGFLHRQPPPGADPPPPAVLVVGRGPLADAVCASLRRGAAVDHRIAYPRPLPTDLAAVVLTDSVVTPPDVVRHLMHDGIPHLPVRCRDGVGVVGPFVVPGRTACLHCVELTRCDLDREWPFLAAQLGGHAASASPTTLTATAAFAVGRVHDFLGDRLLFSQRTTHTRPSPLEMGHSQEIDTAAGTVRRRRWRRHPVCPCSGHAPA
ncbi:TOMM precursor leader peptide-binding protein [Rhodococcus kroppenstedtii]|uniref:TOMM precursor leader peptide-binding protein n=1 Tax=Rhodococcoides kroppenstedtii TaxID=293050 RepID=UPI002955BF31|nr:TOMM precursor leader peptide-binding protein [Rhodococcus kroppenstedtii]MDV7197292.1 TOMM precursor leader peptide-binding protein [Rhodococcus kroppenstedtii]